MGKDPSAPSRKNSKRNNKLMSRTPPGIEGNRLNKHKMERQLAERNRSVYKKGFQGVEIDRDAARRARRPRKNNVTQNQGAVLSTSVTSPPHERPHERHAGRGKRRASHAGRPETRVVQEVASTSKQASSDWEKNIVTTEPTHTPLLANTISMPAGANTAFYARRHRGRAARDAVLTANGATSANTEDGNKSASHQAPPVECTARNDSVKTASPSVHTP